MEIAEHVMALVALTVMEIVLGIDNIVFITILTARLPTGQQAPARTIGLGLALVMRLALLGTLFWILHLEEPLFLFANVLAPLGLPLEWLTKYKEVNEFSVRDVIMLVGGLFLIWKSVHEIHKKLEGEHGDGALRKAPSFVGVLVQIALLDMVFSLDSVITAVGMARSIWIMVAAVVMAVGVMLIFAGRVSAFVERHPTLKMLALCFLLLIGVMLVADGIGTEISKGYIYFAMAFAILVEMLNLWMKARQVPKTVEL